MLLLGKVVLALYLLALPALLFLMWHSGDKARATAARLMDARWGWWHPVTLFWKLGRTQGTLGQTWPLWFGAFPLITYRAGERWTDTYGPPVRQSGR